MVEDEKVKEKRKAAGGQGPKAKEAKSAGKGSTTLATSSAASSGMARSNPAATEEAAAAKHLSASLKENKVL